MPREILLPFRIPRSEIIEGRAYVINARNGGIGVAHLKTDKRLIIPQGPEPFHERLAAAVEGETYTEMVYTLRREKFDNIFLFDEVDWDDCTAHGTAIPLKLLDALPPTDQKELLAWLELQEEEHKEERAHYWDLALKAEGIRK